MTSIYARGTASIRDSPFFFDETAPRKFAGFRPGFAYTMSEIQMLENDGDSVTDLLSFAFPKSDLHSAFVSRSTKEQLQYLRDIKKLLGNPAALTDAQKAERNMVRSVVQAVAADPEVDVEVARVAAVLAAAPVAPVAPAAPAPARSRSRSHALDEFDNVPDLLGLAGLPEIDDLDEIPRSAASSASRRPPMYSAAAAAASSGTPSPIMFQGFAPLVPVRSDGSIDPESFRKSLSRSRDIATESAKAFEAFRVKREWFDDEDREFEAANPFMLSPSRASRAEAAADWSRRGAAAPAAPAAAAASAGRGLTMAQRLLDDDDELSGAKPAPRAAARPTNRNPSTNPKAAQTDVNTDMLRDMMADRPYAPKQLTRVTAEAYARQKGLTIPPGQDARVVVNREISQRKKK